MRVIQPPAKPLPRFEFTKEELTALIEELHVLRLGRDFRYGPHARALSFPKLDEFAFLAESLVE